MIAAILRTQRAQFAALAEAWLTAGATSFSIWSGGALLSRWPTASRQADVDDGEVYIVAPIRLDALIIAEIRVSGLSSPEFNERLVAEAGIISQLARLERDLNSMTTELIDTQDQLLAMYDLTQASRNYHGMEQILKQLAFESNRLIKVEGAFLVLQVPDGQLISEHYPEQLLDTNTVQAYLATVQTTGHELLLNGKNHSTGTQFHNMLLMPIKVSGAVIATLGLVNRLGGEITAPHIKLARAIAEHAGARIENVLLHEDNLRQARLQTEMKLAQNIQLNLLPQKAPEVPGLDLWAQSSPASQVGGDFYDFILRSGRPFSFSVGDVSGKGMPAAMLMTMMRTVLRTKTGVVPMPTPEEVIARSNEELYDDFTDLSMFATVFIGQYDVASRELVYANAGHSPVVFCGHNSAPTLLEADGTAIGILPTSFSEDHAIRFEPGDVLIIATDGLNEARNAQGELFGYERFLDTIGNLADLSAREIANGLFNAVEAYSAGQAQDDDQTLIVIKAVD